MRGSRTHGYGRAHRGSGNKGGYGNASSGKKSDSQKRSYPADYFGKDGFKLHDTHPVVIINIRDLDARVEGWAHEKLAKKEGDVYVVDLGALGYDKLVGGGRLTHKIKVIVANKTASVVDKVKAAGGEIVAN